MMKNGLELSSGQCKQKGPLDSLILIGPYKIPEKM